MPADVLPFMATAVSATWAGLLLCVGMAVTSVACNPDPPTGISVFCESNGKNYYKVAKPGPCLAETKDEQEEDCYNDKTDISIFKCYHDDEWLSGTSGDGTGGSEGSEAGEGIDRYNWPTHEPSLTYIKDYCTSECEYIGGSQDRLCLNENWIIKGYNEVPGKIRTRRLATDLENPGTLNCNIRQRSRSANGAVVQDDPSWLSDNSPIELACLTVENCAGLFDVNIMRHLVPSSPALPGIDEAEAEHLVTTGGGGSIMTLRLANQDYPSERSRPVAGHIEYTALDCGEATCPFYLGNLTAMNMTDSWDLYSEALGGDVEITNVHVRLQGPTLGVWRPSTGEVYFDEQMLELRVDFDLAVAGEPAPTVTKYITNDDGLFGIRHQDAAIQLPNVVIREGYLDLEAFVTISYDTIDGPHPVFDAHEQNTYEEE